jgi:putative membrane protein
MGPSSERSHIEVKSGTKERPKSGMLSRPGAHKLAQHHRAKNRRGSLMAAFVQSDETPEAKSVAMKSHHEIYTKHARHLSRRDVTKLLSGIAMNDWFHSLTACQGRSVPMKPMLFATLFSTIIILLDKFDITTITLPPTILTLTAPALFFLLVFRTNSSYGRWWEGRTIWAQMIDRTRDNARKASVYVENDVLVERIIKYTIAFAYCLKNHLRFEHTLKGLHEVEEVVRLTEGEMVLLLEADHMPLYVLEVLAESVQLALKDGKIATPLGCMMEKNHERMSELCGACERILKTPFPWSYLVHLRTMIMIVMCLLPLVIGEDYGYYTIPAVFIAAYGVFGIEQIGVQVENPFG